MVGHSLAVEEVHNDLVVTEEHRRIWGEVDMLVVWIVNTNIMEHRVVIVETICAFVVGEHIVVS